MFVDGCAAVAASAAAPAASDAAVLCAVEWCCNWRRRSCGCFTSFVSRLLSFSNDASSAVPQHLFVVSWLPLLLLLLLLLLPLLLLLLLPSATDRTATIYVCNYVTNDEGFASLAASLLARLPPCLLACLPACVAATAEEAREYLWSGATVLISKTSALFLMRLLKIFGIIVSFEFHEGCSDWSQIPKQHRDQFECTELILRHRSFVGFINDRPIATGKYSPLYPLRWPPHRHRRPPHRHRRPTASSPANGSLARSAARHPSINRSIRYWGAQFIDLCNNKLFRTFVLRRRMTNSLPTLHSVSKKSCNEICKFIRRKCLRLVQLLIDWWIHHKDRSLCLNMAAKSFIVGNYVSYPTS